MVEVGHVDAPDYPVAFVFEEIELVVERENRRLATEASLMKTAIDTGIAAFGKDSGKMNRAFRDLINKLFGADPEPTKRNMEEGGRRDGTKRRRTSA